MGYNKGMWGIMGKTGEERDNGGWGIGNKGIYREQFGKWIYWGRNIILVRQWTSLWYKKSLNCQQFCVKLLYFDFLCQVIVPD